MQIIFRTNNNRVAILSPAPGLDLTMEEIAAKDVPAGQPWRLINQFPDAPQDQWLWTDEGPLDVGPSPQPEPLPVPQSVSRRQAIKALRVAGVITPEESVAWTKDNILPPFITEYLDMLPPDDLADAYEDLIAATEYRIDAPMVSLLGYAAGINKSEKENLFRLASTF